MTTLAPVIEVDFIKWPKIPRLHRTIFVTEKIDGTNAAVVVREIGQNDAEDPREKVVAGNREGEWPIRFYAVRAQSRKRIITPEDDNFGFAAWVWDNAHDLAHGLGPGAHFGEWWGVGIQRGYGLRERRFSLFNSHRWKEADLAELGLTDIGVHVVPTLAMWGCFDTEVIDSVADDLHRDGSAAAPGFKPAEGLVVYHTASKQMFKMMLEGDDHSKSASFALAA